MTEKEKQDEIDRLYGLLDKCGQILADWDEEKRPTYYEKEYRRIIRQLAKLEPENWPNFKVKRDYTQRNKMIADWCQNNKCPACGGQLRQTRSGSLRVACEACGKKLQLLTRKVKNKNC